MALSQLSRKVEDRTDKNNRPQLSDLRESGAIEQDADIVCFIHRPEYYTHSSEDASGRSIKGKAEFIVAKHRSGAVDDVDLRFVAKYARFQNWEDDYGYQQETVESRISMQDSPGAIPAPDPASDPLGSDGTFDLSRLSNDTKAPF